jgi:hypothetical protein
MFKTLIVLILIILMCSIASASVENVPYGTRNLPQDDTYVMYDFEDFYGENLGLMPSELCGGLIQLSTMTVSGQLMEWSHAHVWGRGMHVYPYDHYWDDFNDTNIPYIYIIEGDTAFCPRTLFGWQYYPASHGRLLFPEGADHVSFLVSTGGRFTVRGYDRHGNYIKSITAEPNTLRVSFPDGPSQWSLVTFESQTRIHRIDFIGGVNMYLLDDLVIGGLPLPEGPADYSYAAERMKTLLGADWLELGLGYNLLMGNFYTSEEIINDLLPYWDPVTKELKTGVGIDDTSAIIYAFNMNEDLVNWNDIDRMAKHDFTEDVVYTDIKPGDVFFIDYPDEDGNPDGHYDEIGIVIEPDTTDPFGNPEDLIRIIPSAGVSLSSSKYIDILYGDSGFVDYKSLPKTPKGGHSPYPKVQSKFLI